MGHRILVVALVHFPGLLTAWPRAFSTEKRSVQLAPEERPGGLIGKPSGGPQFHRLGAGGGPGRVGGDLLRPFGGKVVPASSNATTSGYDAKGPLRASPENMTSLSGAQPLLATARKQPTQTPPKPTIDVMNKTSMVVNRTPVCLCKPGHFWHWRIKECVKQGAWGYECGFFPIEHHRAVCADGLKCTMREGGFAASCTKCGPQDKCAHGLERHRGSCLKETRITGEACSTVRVSTVVYARANRTNSSVEDDAGVVANSTGVAEETACVGVEEVKKIMGLGMVPRVGPVLAARLVSSADGAAFNRAKTKALEAAEHRGKLDARRIAAELAAPAAAEQARLDAEASDREKAAWEEEEDDGL